MDARSLLSLGLLATALCPGCYEEKLEIRLHEDGSGVLRLEKRLSAARSALELAGAVSDEERAARARADLVDELACWDGACVWTGARSQFREGRIAFEASADFDDVRKLARHGRDAVSQAFELREENGNLTLEWTRKVSCGQLSSLEQCARVSAALETTRVEATVTMPGLLFSAEGAEDVDRCSAVWTLFSGDELRCDLGRFEVLVATRFLNEKDAVAAFRSKLERRTIVAICPRSDSPYDRAAHRRERELAAESYARSDLASDVERRRKARGHGAY